MMREIRLALLEADVHLQVVKDLVAEYPRSQRKRRHEFADHPPADVKIVHESLVDIQGDKVSRLAVSPDRFHGDHALRLARRRQDDNRRQAGLDVKKKREEAPADIGRRHRPAAARQLDIWLVRSACPALSS
jgi:hypothetical protein